MSIALDPDDPEPLNKDWYAIVSSDDPDILIVDGPFKDREHWLSEIPARYKGAKVVRRRLVGTPGDADSE